MVDWMFRSCFSCGNVALRISEDLYKCQVCGQYQEVKGERLVPRRLDVYPFGKRFNEAMEKVSEEGPARVEAESEDLTPDMRTFVSRLSESLTPTEGYSREIQRDQLRERRRIVRELERVFLEDLDFNDWFDRTKTRLKMHYTKLAEHIIESLEGLESADAVNMKAAWENALSKGPLG